MSGTEPRVLVVGAGAAGLSAAFTAAWRGAQVRLLDLLGPGGQLQNAGVIETVPGLAPTAGPDLVDQMVRRFDGLDVDVVLGEATSLASGTEGFAVTTDAGETLRADLVIIATGSTPRSLGVPGEAEFEHRGVSHCAACDGPLYRGKDVVVVGGGDGGADAALALHAAGATVTLTHRGTVSRAAAALRRRIDSIDEITVLPATEVTAIAGDQTVNRRRAARRRRDRVDPAGERGVHRGGHLDRCRRPGRVARARRPRPSARRCQPGVHDAGGLRRRVGPAGRERSARRRYR